MLPPPRLTRMSCLGFKLVSSRSRRRQSEAGRGRNCSCSQGLQRVSACDGRLRRGLDVVRACACALRQRGGMRRSGAFTLAVVLTLGAVTGGRGQELSSSVTPADGSSDGFVLPSVPGNWADLPFKLTASQTVSYDSNINSFPVGFAPRGTTVGDFTSSSNFGVSTKANVSSQQLFLDATFGVIHYLHETQNDSTVYSLNAGVNWTVTSRCSGTLAASLSKSPRQLTEQVGTGGNFTTTTALDETGRCAVSNGYSLLFNTGLTTTTNSNATNAINNARTELISAGVEYAKGYSTLTALASISDQNFSDRSAASVAAGLATETDFHSFTLNYTRPIGPNLY